MKRRARPEEALAEDIREHIESETRENIERGMAPVEARHAAIRKFGNVARVQEDVHAVWHWMWLERLWNDVRYAVRCLRRNPGFTAVAVLTLALGIGLNTAVFSVVNAVLLRPLPYPHPGRLLWLSEYNSRFKMELVTGPDFLEWKRLAHSFDRMAAYGYQDMTVSNGARADQVGVAPVTEDFWPISGVQPLLGRLPGPRDHDAVVLSYRFYERWFGQDRGVAGKTITVNGSPKTIVGVLPADFRFVLPREFPGLALNEVELYVPFELTPQNQVRGRNLAAVNVVGRLKPGVPVEKGRAEMATIQAGIVREFPNPFYRFVELRVSPLQDRVVGNARAALLILFASVALVLLIACANIANLLLARASSRQKEFAIRAAMGAGRGRMAGQFVAEGVVLALCGGAAGLLLARAGIAFMMRISPNAVPRLGEASVGPTVLAFTSGLSLATGLLFACWPAYSFSRTRLHPVLKEGGRTSGAGSAGMRVRGLLVASELALALVLLVGAGLLLKSFWRISARPAGFEPEEILVMKVSLTGPEYRDAAPQFSYLRQALDRLAATPGVEAAGLTNSALRGFVALHGAPPPAPGEAPPVTYHSASAGFFRAMGTRLVRGRWITDDEPSKVVLVNETLARRVFGAADPIGRQIDLPGTRPNGAPVPAAIAGVLADLKYSALAADTESEMYIPYRDYPFVRKMDLVVRTSSDPGAVAASLRKRVAEIDPSQPVFGVESLEDALAESVAPRRFNLALLEVFAAAALLLAVVGIYGVVAYGVAQRTHEIGVRMALGAQRDNVVGMVVRQGMLVALGGISAGVAAAFGLTRLMATLLYGVKPTDAAIFTAVPLVLAASALVACVLPALRAARVDPVVALRYE